jgi:hypothetical protein
VKKTIVLAVAVFAMICGYTQNNSSSPAASPFPKAMEAVLNDYTGNFYHISGALVAKEVETESYASTVQLPGAAGCLVTRYHSKEDITASWQAKMFRSEAFAMAAKQYRELYNRLKSCYLRLQDGSSIYLKGEWEEPKEEKSFTVSTFRLTTTDLRYSELKIDLEILYQLDQWVVNINVVSKRKDTLEEDEDSLSK